MIIAVSWLVPRDFRYRGSIKDAVSLKRGEAEAERETALKGRRSVVRPTSDVTLTARDL